MSSKLAMTFPVTSWAQAHPCDNLPAPLSPRLSEAQGCCVNRHCRALSLFMSYCMSCFLKTNKQAIFPNRPLIGIPAGNLIAIFQNDTGRGRVDQDSHRAWSGQGGSALLDSGHRRVDDPDIKGTPSPPADRISLCSPEGRRDGEQQVPRSHDQGSKSQPCPLPCVPWEVTLDLCPD